MAGLPDLFAGWKCSSFEEKILGFWADWASVFEGG